MAPSEDKVKKSKTDKLKGEKVRKSKAAALVERSVQASLVVKQPWFDSGGVRTRCQPAQRRRRTAPGGAASRRRSHT